MKQLKNIQSGFSAVEGVLILVIIGILGFTGYYVWHAKQSADKNLSADQSSTPTYNKKSSTGNQQDPNIQDSELQPAPQPYLTPGPGADWNTYTNKQLAFTFQIPKKINSSIGCYKKDGTYLTTQGAVPAGVFQDGDNFYVDATYTYQQVGEHDTSAGLAEFSGCKKVITTGALITQSQKNPSVKTYSYFGLPIAVLKASSTQDISNWVKRYFAGDRISYDSMTPNKSGWQDVKLKCDNPQENCLNFGFQLRYYAAKHRLVYLESGQAAHLLTPDNKSSYDQQVFASFKLL